LFEVEAIVSGTIVARLIAGGDFTVLPGSRLGDVELEPVLDMPRALDPFGHQRLDLFAMRPTRGDASAFQVGQVLALRPPPAPGDPATVVLYRPVGEKELGLVRDSGWRRYPPRLPEQPIFYPVTNASYAAQIARDWNARDGENGYVTRFEVRADFLSRFDRKVVGASIHEEYWIPAGELPAFNDAIVGYIEILAVFRG
jgi:hypothetical protein